VKLTVFFDGQYWVGVVEETEGTKVRACRHIFGPEPKDGEVLDFVRNSTTGLLDRATQRLETGKLRNERKVNPKRLARQVAEEMRRHGISSYTHQTLQLELEHRKKERASEQRRHAKEMREKKRQLRLQKAKQKHRGR
jgi:hypothetical protein